MSMPELTYKRFMPSRHLLPYVEHFWIVSAPAEEKPRREILIPNGRPMLLLSFASPSVRIDPIGKSRLANSNTFSGILTQPFVIEQSGEARYIGMQFKPYGAAAFLRTKRLVNKAMPIKEWVGRPEVGRLMDQLATYEFGETRVKALDDYLQAKLLPVKESHIRSLESAVAYIEKAGGQIKVSEVARLLSMDYVTFYRMFKGYTGITPKQFLDIVRYYTFVGNLLGDHVNDSGALISSLQGYYDQAHATKEFKRFTGVTPGSFKRTLNNIARLMNQSQ